MSDFATLVLGAETKGLKQGEEALDDLGDAAERAERRTGGSTNKMRDQFGRYVKDTTTGADRVKRSYAGIAAAAGKLIAITAAGVMSGRAIRTIADFGQAMSKVEAISGATTQQLSDMRDMAKELGSTTEFTATQAAEGMTFLAMAGFDANEAMAALPSTLDLATAAGMGLGQSADITSNVLSGFGLEATKAGRAADVLAAASSSSNTDVGQLGQAMSTAAPIAASLSIGMEETAAAIGTMSDAGIQGSRAGTAMRGVLASLAGPTEQAREALANYGLSAADVNVETHGLSGVLKTLQGVGLSTADAMTIFGREAASGALVLIDGADRVKEFTGQLQEADGSAKDMADTMRDNLGGDITALGSALSGLVLAIGDAGVTGALRSMVQTGTAGLQVLIENMDLIQGVAIAAGTAFTIQTIPALVATTGAVYAQVAAWVTLRGAIMATGYGALIIGAGYLISKFIELVRVTGSFSGALGALKDIAAESLGRIPTLFDGVVYKLKAADLQMQADFVDAVHGMVESLGPVSNAIIRAFVAPYKAVVAAWEALPGAFKRIGAMAMNGLIATVESAIGGLITPINSILEAVQLPPIPAPDLSAWKATVPEAQSIGAAISEAVAGVANTEYVGEGGIWTEQLGAMRDDMQATSELARELGDAFIDNATRPLESIQKLKQAAEEGGNAVADMLEGKRTDQDGKLPGAGDFQGGSGGGAGGAGENATPLEQKLEELMGTLQTKTEVIREWYNENLEILRTAREQELITEQEFMQLRERLEAEHQDRLSQLKADGGESQVSSVLSAGNKIVSAIGQTNKKAFGIAKAFGAAEVMVNAIVGASKELKEKGMIGIATAASVIAAGVGFMTSLRGINPSTGGAGASVGYGGRTALSSSRSRTEYGNSGETETTTFNFTLRNDPFGIGESIARQIVEQLNEANRNGMRYAGRILV